MNHKLTGHEAGLASYWEMDEPSNSAPTTFDATKDFEYALLSPPISRVVSTAPVSPPGNYALAFTNSAVSIPHLNIQDAYPLTVMCWFLAATNNSGGALV